MENEGSSSENPTDTVLALNFALSETEPSQSSPDVEGCVRLLAKVGTDNPPGTKVVGNSATSISVSRVGMGSLSKSTGLKVKDAWVLKFLEACEAEAWVQENANRFDFVIYLKSEL